VSGPLAGRVVLVTRPAGRAEALADLLGAAGAGALVAPTVVVEPPGPGGPFDRALGQANRGRFQWVAFTSGSAVRAWADRSAALGLPPPRARVAAVGAATAEALAAAGLRADLVPETFTISALGEAFPEGRGPVLLPRADLATPDLERALRSKGWTPVRVEAYRIRPADELPPDAVAALRDGRVDAITFTSPSTVDGFVRLAGVVRGPVAACIGPVTAEATGRAGFGPVVVAEPHTADGLVRAVIRALR